MTTLPRLLVPLILFILIPATAFAQGVPDLGNSTIETRAVMDVSLMICPSCDGPPLIEARLFDGVTMDATIEVYMLDWEDNPIAGFPLEDIWLDSPDLCFCPGGSVADFSTDANGYTEFSDPLCGGGCSEIPSLTGYLNGDEISPGVIPFIRANSPDMNCSLQINLADIGLFAAAYRAPYSYCADFNYDGRLNLADVGIIAYHSGHDCP